MAEKGAKKKNSLLKSKIFLETMGHSVHMPPLVSRGHGRAHDAGFVWSSTGWGGRHMAFDVALFQLGMDLDQGSSTAQTEEKHSVCGPDVAQQDRKDYFCERNGEKLAGTHLIIDVKNGHRLDDLQHIETTFRKCIEVAGATLLHIHMHHFTPNGGVSGVAVLAESHISIHSAKSSFTSIFAARTCPPLHNSPATRKPASRRTDIMPGSMTAGHSV
jgi:hypothetical protein